MYPAGTDEQGFSLVEVMIAMVILAFSILGVTAMFQWADGGLSSGRRGAQALALAKARLEAKQQSPWQSLLSDDLDLDGIADYHMVDDGTHGDHQAGDGIYTGLLQRGGITLEWTVGPVWRGQLGNTGRVTVQSRATYQIGNQIRSVTLATMRANPGYGHDPS